MALIGSGSGLGSAFTYGSLSPAHLSWLGVRSTASDSYDYEVWAWLDWDCFTGRGGCHLLFSFATTVYKVEV